MIFRTNNLGPQLSRDFVYDLVFSEGLGLVPEKKGG